MTIYAAGAILWREEKGKDQDIEPEGNDLRSVGVSVGDLESDAQAGEEMNAPETDEMGMEPAGAVSADMPGAAGTTGGAPAGVGM